MATISHTVLEELLSADLGRGSAIQGFIREGELHVRTEWLARGLAEQEDGSAPHAGGALPVPPVVVPLPVQPQPVRVGNLGTTSAASSTLLSAPVAPPRRFAGPGGCWVLDEPGDTHVVGQEVVIPVSSLTFGRRSIVQAEALLFSVS